MKMKKHYTLLRLCVLPSMMLHIQVTAMDFFDELDGLGITSSSLIEGIIAEEGFPVPFSRNQQPVISSYSDAEPEESKEAELAEQERAAKELTAAAEAPAGSWVVPVAIIPTSGSEQVVRMVDSEPVVKAALMRLKRVQESVVYQELLLKLKWQKLLACEILALWGNGIEAMEPVAWLVGYKEGSQLMRSRSREKSIFKEISDICAAIGTPLFHPVRGNKEIGAFFQRDQIALATWCRERLKNMMGTLQCPTEKAIIEKIPTTPYVSQRLRRMLKKKRKLYWAQERLNSGAKF